MSEGGLVLDKVSSCIISRSNSRASLFHHWQSFTGSSVLSNIWLDVLTKRSAMEGTWDNASFVMRPSLSHCLAKRVWRASPSCVSLIPRPTGCLWTARRGKKVDRLDVKAPASGMPTISKMQDLIFSRAIVCGLLEQVRYKEWSRSQFVYGYLINGRRES